MDKRVELLDYLKGYSIFTIVIFHLITNYKIYDFNNLIRTIAQFGGAGVHIFILCSGFGLLLSYAKKPISYKQFILRRFTKIYVPYIFIILLSAFVPFMYKGDKIIAVLSHVFLFKMFIQDFESSFGVQFWFISTLIQFYLIFYFLVYLKNKLGNRKYIILSIIISILYSIVVVLLGKYDVRVWNSFFLQYLWEFSLGMILAEYFLKQSVFNKPNIKKLLSVSLAGIVITGVTGYLGGPFKMFNDYTSLFGYGGLSICIYLLNIRYLNNFFRWICTFSYEWYLLHILVFSCISHFLKMYMPSFTLLIVSIILSMVSAYLYKFLCQKFLHKIIIY